MRTAQWVVWLLLAAGWFGFAQVSSAATSESDAGARLHTLFKEEWEYWLQEDPTFASELGDRRWNDRWPDISLDAFERRQRHRLEVLHKLDAIETAALSDTDRVNYRLFRRDYEFDAEGYQYRTFLIPLNQRGGIQTLNELADSLRFATVKDYEDWIARLRALPAFMDQTIALMREGIRSRIVHPRVVMERVPDQITRQIVTDPADSLFFQPFKRFPDSVSDSERQRLAAEAKQAITEYVFPSYRRFQEFFNKEYLPACFHGVGAWRLPRGKEYYAYRVKLFTTTDLTPEQVHEIGQREVRRIRAEMEKIIQQVGFQGSFQEFLEFLRTDPQFYYKDPQELLEAYRALAKRIDPELVKLFGRLPRMPYGVEPIPDNIAPDTTTAYYRQPAADGSRAGTYFVNLYKPEVRPKYEMEALSIHEAVPGHHLQIALAMELGELPEFRRYGGYTAFTEGWGLYSESLGEEMGLYKDPYSKFGQLTYEMWRAVRLVVDTGLHYMGWTREQAIEFFKANAAKTEHDIVNEIDRYIAWPGQALAYKIGELKIKELRARAQQELGPRFDLRAFHDVVLGSGAVTLDVLESNVNDWIHSRQADAAATGH
jgi:prolyl oligopeptidase